MDGERFVFVPENQVKKALQILHTDEQNQDAEPINEPSHCPSCNAEWESGFIVCWNCQTSL